MNDEEIKKLLEGNSDDLIRKMTELGIDFKDLGKDIAKDLVKRRYKDLTDEHFDAVDFVFWAAYFIERTAEELIIEPEVVQFKAREVAVRALVSKLHFGDKIKIISELHAKNDDPLVKIMWVIKNFRDDIAHGRFNNLVYGSYHLSDNRGKLKLVAAIRDSFDKK